MRIARTVALCLVAVACSNSSAGDGTIRRGARYGSPDDPSAPSSSGGPPDGTNVLPGADGGNQVAPTVRPTKKVADLTGPGTSSKPFGVGGADLGIPVRQPNGKIAYVFGDTFEGDGVGLGAWRSPVLLRSDPGMPTTGVTFNAAAGGAYAKQILDYQHDTDQWSTWLPSDVITIGDRMYLHFIVNKGLGHVQWTQIAYSDDNGENWTLSDTRFEANEDNGLRQMWTWERGGDGYVYVVSSVFIARDQPIIMYRVPENSILDRAAYQSWGYMNGAWAWGNPASVILPGKFGELCLRRVENKWVLSYFNSGEYNITIKVFDKPTDDLTKAKTYQPIRGTSWGAESDTAVAQLYGGYIHPDSTLRDLHLIISQWHTSAPNGWPYRAMQFVTGVE